MKPNNFYYGDHTDIEEKNRLFYTFGANRPNRNNEYSLWKI